MLLCIACQLPDASRRVGIAVQRLVGFELKRDGSNIETVGIGLGGLLVVGVVRVVVDGDDAVGNSSINS